LLLGTPSHKTRGKKNTKAYSRSTTIQIAGLI
jgi:hypothetical protein